MWLYPFGIRLVQTLPFFYIMQFSNIQNGTKRTTITMIAPMVSTMSLISFFISFVLEEFPVAHCSFLKSEEAVVVSLGEYVHSIPM